MDSLDTADRLRRAIRRIDRRLRQTVGATNLSPSQYEVLATIVRRAPIGHGDLAAAEGLNPTMLSRIVGKLEAAGLVGRLPDSSDGRAVHLVATEAGRSLFDRIRGEANEALHVALAQLREVDRRALLAALPTLDALAESLTARNR